MTEAQSESYRAARLAELLQRQKDGAELNSLEIRQLTVCVKSVAIEEEEKEAVQRAANDVKSLA